MSDSGSWEFGEPVVQMSTVGTSLRVLLAAGAWYFVLNGSDPPHAWNFEREPAATMMPTRWRGLTRRQRKRRKMFQRHPRFVAGNLWGDA